MIFTMCLAGIQPSGLKVISEYTYEYIFAIRLNFMRIKNTYSVYMNAKYFTSGVKYFDSYDYYLSSKKQYKRLFI